MNIRTTRLLLLALSFVTSGLALAGAETATATLAPSGFGATSSPIAEALQRGRWPLACQRATSALAGAQPDVEALGIFALCAAINHDQPALTQANARLKEAETVPYYATLVAAVSDLHAQRPAPALVQLTTLTAARPQDALAQFFLGEARYANGEPAAARRCFEAVLTSWPAHAPAMLALSRLDATEARLPQAIARMEQATQIDPQNRDYWRWLADLCTQAGDPGRAQAITLQRLRVRSPSAHLGSE